MGSRQADRLLEMDRWIKGWMDRCMGVHHHGMNEIIQVDGLLLRAQEQHELIGGALEDEGACNHGSPCVHHRVNPSL